MELWQKIIEAYPEINPTDCFPKLGIHLRNDSDGTGAYIDKWEYSKPIPSGLTLGKPAGGN
jgi:hypothetical protein